MPDAASLIFNLEFTAGLAKEYTFKAEISDEWSKTSSFILEDKLTKSKYSLINGTSFKFSSDVADAKDRFRLIVDILTGIENKKSDEKIKITSRDRHVDITTKEHYQTGNIYVYELSGKQIYSRKFTTGALGFDLPNAGFYLVQLLFNNERVTRKIYTP